jgi:uncharacterized membrane protein YhaH (DUF805 family)
MEKYQKYFEFSGTINGTNYLLRNLLTTIVSYIGGYLIGYGMGLINYGFITLGLILVAPSIWMSVATIYKRTNALFPTYASSITLTVIICQLMGGFTKGLPVGEFFTLGLAVFSLVLAFKNSGIGLHKG